MKNKRALVCGSSKGIGAATAIELSKLGTSIKHLESLFAASDKDKSYFFLNVAMIWLVLGP